MQQKLVVLIGCLMMSCAAYAQQDFTGSNSCLIQISTERKNYTFVTEDMYARLNDSMDRFEFTLPLCSIQSQSDSSDMTFLRTFAQGSDAIVIHALLPGDKESVLDLSYFKGNKAINLPGEIRIGKFTFEDDIAFNGMLMGENQEMAFDFTFFLNESTSPAPYKVGNDQIMEVKLTARGDKMIGLTAN